MCMAFRFHLWLVHYLRQEILRSIVFVSLLVRLFVCVFVLRRLKAAELASHQAVKPPKKFRLAEKPPEKNDVLAA